MAFITDWNSSSTHKEAMAEEHQRARISALETLRADVQQSLDEWRWAEEAYKAEEARWVGPEALWDLFPETPELPEIPVPETRTEEVLLRDAVKAAIAERNRLTDPVHAEFARRQESRFAEWRAYREERDGRVYTAQTAVKVTRDEVASLVNRDLTDEADRTACTMAVRRLRAAEYELMSALQESTYVRLLMAAERGKAEMERFERLRRRLSNKWWIFSVKEL